jgi:hypothetical protein
MPFFWPFSKKQENAEDPTRENSAVRHFVDTLLKDVRFNNSMIPDTVERKMYVELFETLLEVLKKVADTTVLEFMNHRITFQIEPIMM